MFFIFKKGIDFIKRNPGLLYSLLLIVLIPFAFYYNTFSTVKSFQKNIDYELQTKALLAESIFSVFAPDILENPELLQQKIQQVTKENPEIANIQVILPEEGKFKIIASKDTEEIGKEVSIPSIDWAWAKDQAVAELTAKNGKRFWNMVKPISDSEGEKVALVTMLMSLEKIDLLVLETVRNSYIILIIAILLSLFLIIQHTQLFKYPILLRKLQEVDKMKDEFLRMALHELQSPVVNIRGYIEALRDEMADLLTEKQKESFYRISISAKNLSDLIYDMLEVSRIEQGRLDFTPQKVSPPEIINELVKEFERKASAKGLKLIFQPTQASYFINVNPHRLKQVLTNLIENAIKYTKEGKIEITTWCSEVKKKYFIAVRDTGIGISAEAQKRLFEKFYRVKTKETAGIPGTGLGLWICKEICKKMGGEILVESMEGVGTKFTISFPLVKSK
jgi:signal transduction histidine kinase